MRSAFPREGCNGVGEIKPCVIPFVNTDIVNTGNISIGWLRLLSALFAEDIYACVDILSKRNWEYENYPVFVSYFDWQFQCNVYKP